MPKAPAWIIAVAVVIIMVRYVFFPPCCTTRPATLLPTTTYQLKVDSAGTVVDTMFIALTDTLYVNGSALEVRGVNAKTRALHASTYLVR